ncbi:hypothetical protein N7G274_004411 [Stereocaulon virgatum]|uniref:CRAL-TRIO domain-containing protein n=1 Tax=Stereocaulon virgatum TaxID=373712 RepID=A0ABR4A9U0_9LECA
MISYDHTMIERDSLSDQSPFDAFKAKCSENGLLSKPEELREEDLCDGINDDVVLLRFLRARKCDVEEAYKMFSAVCITRTRDRHCTFYDNVDVKAYNETRKMYPHWAGRRDKFGQPVCYLDIEAITSKSLATHRQTSASLKVLEMNIPKSISIGSLRPYAIFDNAVRFVLPLCSAVPNRPNPHKPITKAVYVVDISSITLKQVWDMRNWIKNTSGLLADAYPEIVDKILIIGAPSYMPTIWDWVKGWIDPVTASKIRYLKPTEVLTTLTTLIEMADIPKKYGGELTWECGMLPDLDPAIKELLNGMEYPVGPVKWIEGERAERIVVAVGSVDGKKRVERLATTASSHQPEPLLVDKAEDATVGDEKHELTVEIGMEGAKESPVLA